MMFKTCSILICLVLFAHYAQSKALVDSTDVVVDASAEWDQTNVESVQQSSSETEVVVEEDQHVEENVSEHVEDADVAEAEKLAGLDINESVEVGGLLHLGGSLDLGLGGSLDLGGSLNLGGSAGGNGGDDNTDNANSSDKPADGNSSEAAQTEETTEDAADNASDKSANDNSSEAAQTEEAATEGKILEFVDVDNKEGSEEIAAVEEEETLAPTCTTPGFQPHETDCHLYYHCTALNSPDGTLRLQTLACPENQAFSTAYGRCGRDISACNTGITCLVTGTVPDPLSTTSYYLCQARPYGVGFLLYHIQCGEGEIFLPAIGRCFIDTSVENAYLTYNWAQVHDADVVKAEIKQFKTEEKLKMQLEKEKLKAEKKLQKELEKLAKKQAKEAAKAAAKVEA